MKRDTCTFLQNSFDQMFTFFIMPFYYFVQEVNEIHYLRSLIKHVHVALPWILNFIDFLHKIVERQVIESKRLIKIILLVSVSFQKLFRIHTLNMSVITTYNVCTCTCTVNQLLKMVCIGKMQYHFGIP